MIQGSKVKNSKLELTEAERELLLLGNDMAIKLNPNDDNNSDGGSNNGGINGKRKRR